LADRTIAKQNPAKAQQARPGMTNPLFDTLFGRHAGKGTLFLQLPGGGLVSHDNFLRQTARLANLFKRLGLKVGDRVAAQVEKSAEALAVYAACVQSGLVFLPLNTAYTAAEVSYFTEDSGAALLICDPSRLDELAPVASKSGALLETLDGKGRGSLETKSTDQSAAFGTIARAENDLAAILYTSGTTGRSKGAMLTQGNLLSNALTLVDTWHFDDRDVLLHALPIFHTHGLFVAINTMLAGGGSMIYLPKFDIDAIIAALPQATAMMGVPTFYTRLLDDPRFTAELVRHMRLFVSGSAPLLAETHTQFEKRTGHRILERYGMTETNMNTSNPYGGERRAGTVGFPLSGVELKITDPETGATLPDGEIGIIEVRGPNVFAGYWQMPEKTREDLRPDGFFITGDLGMIDTQGYVQIVGRNKDLIISGGYNIYPKEVELLLDAQPGVAESAVIGVPHADLGETIVAVLVASGGIDPDLDAIDKAISTDLARFKQPRKLVVVAELPRNTMGKVQKNVLRQQFADLFANAGRRSG
jgi:malonyl-CoA/methylmalonyl-CoA synthetase